MSHRGATLVLPLTTYFAKTYAPYPTLCGKARREFPVSGECLKSAPSNSNPTVRPSDSRHLATISACEADSNHLHSSRRREGVHQIL